MYSVCPRILLSCFRARNSAPHRALLFPPFPPLLNLTNDLEEVVVQLSLKKSTPLHFQRLLKVISRLNLTFKDGGVRGGGQAHRQAADRPRLGMNCIKIGLPGKSILRTQENRTSRRPFFFLRISFPGRPIFIQLPPGRGEGAAEGHVQGV